MKHFVDKYLGFWSIFLSFTLVGLLASGFVWYVFFLSMNFYYTKYLILAGTFMVLGLIVGAVYKFWHK